MEKETHERKNDCIKSSTSISTSFNDIIPKQQEKLAENIYNILLSNTSAFQSTVTGGSEAVNYRGIYSPSIQ